MERQSLKIIVLIFSSEGKSYHSKKSRGMKIIALVGTKSYSHKLTYQKHDQKKDNSQQHKIQIIWLKPPYATTNQGKIFLSLIGQHFPSHHKLHKLFDQNNVKISYSCLPNTKSIIHAHNRKIPYPSSTIGRRTCNCINIPQCPLQ